jgi:predicted O-methyltransferase YrrM
MPTIERAQATDGYMSDEELQWLAEQALSHELIVEVGSYLGRSTLALACNSAGTVYALDDWLGPRDVPDPDPSSVWQRFKAATQDVANIVPVACDHASPPEIGHPDMVFIDGSHEYADAWCDIAHWHHRLAPGGLLCGHDIDWSGVQLAVNILLPGFRMVSGTTLWYWKEEFLPNLPHSP